MKAYRVDGTVEDFWHEIDSQAGGWSHRQMHHRADCPHTNGEPWQICRCGAIGEWVQVRRGCIAASASGEKCREHASAAFPFCERYHFDRALGASLSALAAAIATRLDRTEGLADVVGALAMASSVNVVDLADALNPPPLETVLAPRPEPRPERTALYRHFDADGVLLYVGIANDPALRFKTHATSSPWTQFAARHEGEWFASREEAALAERAAIRDEAPLFNKTHAAPDRDARVREYLIAHEAWDLLVPAA